MRIAKLAASITMVLGIAGATLGVASGNNAIDQLMERARAGDTVAERQLGEAYLLGKGVPQDVGQGLSWLDLAAQDNDAHAHYLLAKHYSEGQQSYDTQRRVVDHLTQAAKLGHTTAQARLGEMLIAKARDPQLPQAERERVRSNGVAFLRHAANAKNGYAAYRLGELLWAGKEVARDEAAAVANFEVAATAGQVAAHWWLAQRRLDATGSFHDEGRGVAHLIKAADGGVAPAALQLAMRLESGDGVPRDLAKAKIWADSAVRHQVPGARDVQSSINETIAGEQRAKLAAAAPTQPTQQPVPPARPDAEPRLIAVSTTSAAAPSATRPTPTAPVPLPHVSAAPNDGDAGGLAWADGSPAAAGYAQLNQRVEALEGRIRSLEQTVVQQREELASRDAIIAALTQERDAAIARRDEAENLLRQIASNVETYSRSSTTQPVRVAPAAKPAPVLTAEQAYRAGIEAMRAARYDVAIAQFSVAGRQGHAGALNNLGMLHLQGRGTKVDASRAIAYFEQSAGLGLASAANNLGYIYQAGAGVPADRSLAARWYRQAVALGHADAQRALAALEPTGTARIAAK